MTASIDTARCDWAACTTAATVDTGDWRFCPEHAAEDASLDDDTERPSTVTVVLPTDVLDDDQRLLTAVRDALTQPSSDPTDDIARLPLSALFADPAYQRPLDEKRIDRMAADFDPALVGVLEVSDRGDGTYAIVDGQHRWALLRNVLDDQAQQVPCRIHTGLDRDAEAALFYDIDASRRNLTGWDRWTARRSADDPAVLDVERICAARGLRTGDRTLAGQGVLRATKTAEEILDAGGVDLLARTLDIAVAAWGADDPDTLTNAPLAGVAALLDAYPRDDLDIERLITRLQTLTPRQLKARAIGLRERQPGTMPRLVAAVIVELYNSGLSGNARLQPFAVRVRPQSQPGRGAPGAVTRTCRVCDAPLVKKPGPGRWPAYCTGCRGKQRTGAAA